MNKVEIRIKCNEDDFELIKETVIEGIQKEMMCPFASNEYKPECCGEDADCNDCIADNVIVAYEEESELSSEEIVRILCEEYTDGTYCDIFGHDYCIDDLIKTFTPSEIIQKIIEWKEVDDKFIISQSDIDSLLNEKFGEGKWKIE